MNKTIRTPKTHPDDPVVGHHFAGYSSKARKTEIWLCDSYDPSIGYWMTNVADPSDRHNVSERAIGRTFHEAEDRGGEYWWVSAWGTKVPKQTHWSSKSH